MAALLHVYCNGTLIAYKYRPTSDMNFVTLYSKELIQCYLALTYYMIKVLVLEELKADARLFFVCLLLDDSSSSRGLV